MKRAENSYKEPWGHLHWAWDEAVKEALDDLITKGALTALEGSLQDPCAEEAGLREALWQHSS